MNREVKIGIIVAAALAMLYWGGTYLSGSNPFKDKNDYFAYYEDVNGLLVSNEVRYQGFKVGRVSDISYEKELNKWKVTFSVDQKGLGIRDSAIAMVGSADILGTMVIELVDITKGTKELEPGETMKAAVQKGIQDQVDERIRPLVVKVESLIGDVDSVIKVVTKILDKETIGSIQGSMEKIPLAVKNLLYVTQVADSIVLDIKDKKIGDAIANINAITYNLRKNNQTLTSIFENIDQITDSIAQSNVRQTFNHLNDVLAKVDSIAVDVQAGKGSLGLLLKDDALYNNLAYSAADLDLLLMDLRNNPKRYFHFSVFGKKKEKNTPKPERDPNDIPESLVRPIVQRIIQESLDSLQNSQQGKK